MSPRVSVILPTHDRPALLQEALASLQAQTFVDWEAVVVDDASDPPVRNDWGDARVRVVRHAAARGGAAAKNSGIVQARGEIVAYLDDDDRLAPEYLAQALQALDAEPGVDVVFMGVAWFGRRAEPARAGYEQAMARFLAHAGARPGPGLVHLGERALPALLRSVPMALQRPVVRAAALARIGGYRPGCLLWDCEWALEAALRSQAALLPAPLYEQRVDGQGYSSQSTRAAEHLRSGIEIRQRLRLRSEDPADPWHPHRPALRRSLAEAWFALAWHHYLGREPRAAWAALARSLGRQPQGNQLKLLLRLTLRIHPAIALWLMGGLDIALTLGEGLAAGASL